MKNQTLIRPAHGDVRIEGGFWGNKLELICTVTLWDILQKFENDRGEGILSNFIRVSEGKTGRHIGPPWYDGLFYEVIRGASDFLAHRPDPALDARLDAYIRSIADAQAPDGYINTYGTLICPDKRWGQNGGSLIWQHELYNIGCLAEAGVHHYLATGKEQLLSVAVKAVNCVCGEIGEGKKNIVPAHSLPEEALIKLYNLLKDNPALSARLNAMPDRYLELAGFFIDHRGVHGDRASFPHYMGEYAQDHCPVLQQTEAVGHAVRAALCYTGLTALGIEKDPVYLDAARRLWDNVAETKLHISGGIGAYRNEERFGSQYDLPNNAYLETCAGAALCFWAGEMHRAFGEAKYMDVFERTLYNNVLPCLSLDGTHYFYENPLISDGTAVRWDWHDCPCCPPMLLKLMGALPDYVYSVGADGLYINLLMGSRFRGNVCGNELTVQQTDCRLPWEGFTRATVRLNTPAQFAVCIRIPEWAGNMNLFINEEAYRAEACHGYLRISRTWSDHDRIDIQAEMPVRKMEAHPFVEADRGRVALMRGPLLYCVEQQDNETTDPVLLDDMPEVSDSPLFGGSKILTADTENGRCLAVPYFCRANRGPGKMAVWLRQKGKNPTGFSSRFSQTGIYTASVNTAAEADSLAGWDGILYREYRK